KIACTIQDSDFYAEIDAGKKFSKGDVLECEMKIKKKLEAATNTYLNHSYTVIRVIKHHPRAETQRLEF
ncbi:MAG: hypothetical protein NTY93_01895, partial [Candidatus Kaiserbacteria bacterium]|nr:hypothetical protein [Candidatus Kaiserbacteria bacterium]